MGDGSKSIDYDYLFFNSDLKPTPYMNYGQEKRENVIFVDEYLLDVKNFAEIKDLYVDNLIANDLQSIEQEK